MKTFQDFATENLQAFNWSIPANEIPDYQTVSRVLNVLNDWWLAIGDQGRAVARYADLSDGLWNAGMLTEWPSLYNLIRGNAFGTFSDTMNDILAALVRANNQVGEQPSDPISNVHEVVGDQN